MIKTYRWITDCRGMEGPSEVGAASLPPAGHLPVPLLQFITSHRPAFAFLISA